MLVLGLLLLGDRRAGLPGVDVFAHPVEIDLELDLRARRDHLLLQLVASIFASTFLLRHHCVARVGPSRGQFLAELALRLMHGRLRDLMRIDAGLHDALQARVWLRLHVRSDLSIGQHFIDTDGPLILSVPEHALRQVVFRTADVGALLLLHVAGGVTNLLR